MSKNELHVSTGGGFEPVPCPHCGYVEMLDANITGNWDCENCGDEFWITPMRFYSGKPLELIHDRDGRPVGYQLPLSYLSLFPTEQTRSSDENRNND